MRTKKQIKVDASSEEAIRVSNLSLDRYLRCFSRLAGGVFASRWFGGLMAVLSGLAAPGTRRGVDCGLEKKRGLDEKEK